MFTRPDLVGIPLVILDKCVGEVDIQYVPPKWVIRPGITHQVIGGGFLRSQGRAEAGAFDQSPGPLLGAVVSLGFAEDFDHDLIGRFVLGAVSQGSDPFP